MIAGLKEKSGGLCVVLLGRDVQGRKSDLPACVVLEEDSDNLVVKNELLMLLLVLLFLL